MAGKNERDHQYWQQPVLDAERGLAPYIEDIGHRYRPVLVFPQVVRCRRPGRGQQTRVIVRRRERRKRQPCAVSRYKPGRLQEGLEKPSLRRESVNAETHLTLVQGHSTQQRLLRGDRIAGGLDPVEQLVTQPGCPPEPLICEGRKQDY